MNCFMGDKVMQSFTGPVQGQTIHRCSVEFPKASLSLQDHPPMFSCKTGDKTQGKQGILGEDNIRNKD